MEQTNQFGGNHQSNAFPKEFRLEEVQGLRVGPHACKGSKRALHEANDHFRRANRDLGELAAFILASLTTVTAMEAVINIAVSKLELKKDMIWVAFDLYIGFLVAILVLGAIRFGVVMHKRARAEKEIDQAKRAVYEFCPTEQWPKPEE